MFPIKTNIIMKKPIYQVTVAERDEILNLYERQNGLTELAKILTADNDELYERLIKDLAQTSEKSQNWWQSLSRKYRWESHPEGHWEIDFNDGVIYLITPDEI